MSLLINLGHVMFDHS